MSDPRVTEERLRNHLDSNQVMRERMCLALLPLLGPYTQERPRRPKGGPDGGRDIEAVHERQRVVWGAVGFRNGGGNDQQARKDAQDKFNDDLNRAIEENPNLQGFVFFTNVDLTPGIIEALKAVAATRNVSFVDVFDVERLRHTLDSPEGLIARLQYLDIPMSSTEQIALVSKFGNQMQNAVLARFDRVERTLGQMEQFLAFQKPIHRLDVILTLNGKLTSAEIGEEWFLVSFRGLPLLDQKANFLCINQPSHKNALNGTVTAAFMWSGPTPQNFVPVIPSLGTPSTLRVLSELIISTVGNRTKLADLTNLTLEVHLTPGLYKLANRIAIDVNGFELFDCPMEVVTDEIAIELPEGIGPVFHSKKWVKGVSEAKRNMHFNPPRPSGRLLPLVHNSS